MSSPPSRFVQFGRALRLGRKGDGAGRSELRESRRGSKRDRLSAARIGTAAVSARSAKALRRWATVGTVLGGLTALLLFAPARWLASAIASGSEGRVVLADASGSIWNGSAVVVLAGGLGAIEARVLPGRLSWTLRPMWTGMDLALRHACCLNEQPHVRLLPGLGKLRVEVHQQGDWLGSWPAALLVGLGTPWNTLQPGGALRLSTTGLALVWVSGRFAFEGRADVEWRDMSSRVATLPRLGSYRLAVASTPTEVGTATVQLSTVEGPLLLTGSGSWGAGGLRLRGEATAAEVDQPALANLLNIIGRRDGARSLISIG
ncbi:MAG: type II secretion system protein N [Burkholderiales bacterium]|nr:type II secretion system protein N [Burkholderiales bacterium]